MLSMQFSVVTSFHFGKPESGSTLEYSRLVRGLRSTVSQLGNRDSLVLVASGPEAQTLSLDELFRDVGIPYPNVHRVEAGGGNVQSANAGFKTALEKTREDHWICSVQSSVVLASDWFKQIAVEMSPGDGSPGYFGRLLGEENPDIIWGDGHFLSAGKTYNGNWSRPLTRASKVKAKSFPCLSAAAYNGQFVRCVVEKYDAPISARIDRYGDCTDLALRIRAVAERDFKYVHGAVGYKWWPVLSNRQVLASQLITAGTYYRDKSARLEEATSRVIGRPDYDEAVALANENLERPYEDDPPAGCLLDHSWG